MVDILGMVFKQFSSQLRVCTNASVSAVEKSVLVVGDENISRSLLFLAAVTAASELGVKVVFFTQSQIQSLPFNFHGSAASGLKPEYLKKIRFVYPKTLEDLLEDVASLHELVAEAAALPSLVIVDAAFLTQNLENQAQCRVIVSIQPEWKGQGPGLQVDGKSSAEEQLRWHVVLQPNGTLEFCPASPEQGETPQGQNPVEVNNETPSLNVHVPLASTD
ncbi:hypothetical protein AOLI_G00166660 [Acnodon oligacanthus]